VWVFVFAFVFFCTLSNRRSNGMIAPDHDDDTFLAADVLDAAAVLRPQVDPAAVGALVYVCAFMYNLWTLWVYVF
jgi:hypothetical protein